MNRAKRLMRCALVAMLAASPLVAANSDNWPQWRGANGQGFAESGAPPVEWSETKNVKWKAELPGLGTSTPIIWGDRVFVTTAIDTGKSGPNQPEEPGTEGGFRRSAAPKTIFEWRLIALDRATGKVVWSKVAHEGQPHEGTHPDGTHASNSPITDGELVYAFFGSQGIHAYDFDGNRKWQKDLGDMTIRLGFGEGASPALHGDRLVINWDHEGDSFVVALDKNSGEELWRRTRKEATSWSTPFIVEHGGKAQVIVNATHRVASYDLANGETLWETSGMTMNVIPTPLYADGVVYVTSGFRGNATLAIGLEGASGNLTDSDHILWRYDQDTPYVPSPVLYKGLIYMLKHNKGLLTVIDARSGEAVYGIERLDNVRNVYASAFAANDHVYFMGRDGGGTVIKAGKKFEIVADNQLDDRFDASPAAAGDELFLRGRKALYCIAEAQ